MQNDQNRTPRKESAAQKSSTPYNLNRAAPCPVTIAGICGHDAGIIGHDQRNTQGVTHVQNLLSLMAAPRNVRDMVACGKVSATLAIETLRKHGKEAEQVLSAAVTTASASGKDRVTKKQLGQDGAAGRGPRFSKALMARSVSWVVENKLEEDARILDLLAYLGGMDADGVRKLITTPQEPAVNSDEQAAGQSADAGDAGAGTDNTDQA